MMHLLQPLDVTAAWEINGSSLTYTRRNQDPEQECFVKLPMEAPCYMRVLRILKKEPTQSKFKNAVSGHESVGVTIELDYYTVGVKLYIRYGKDHTLKVFADDAEGRELIGDWSSE